MIPQPGQLIGVTLEFIGVNPYTGLGVYNVIGTARQVEIRQVYP